MESKTIYSDASRTIQVNGNSLHVQGKREIWAPLSAVTISVDLPTGVAGQLRKAGEDPGVWRTVRTGACPLCVLPMAAAEAVQKAAAAARTEIDTWRRDPANTERINIHGMIAQAERIKDRNLDQYYALLDTAQTALAAWREKYPEAARQEDRDRLLADAKELEARALGALVYDADGALDGSARKQIHDELMAKAAEKRRAAEAI